ncbi:MAG: hypothetical protein ABW022_10080 [Actinoplanes sp.]
MRTRLASAVLIGVSFMSLTACGSEETPTAASTPPPAATSAAPAPDATSAAPEATSDKKAPSDKQLCQTAGKADEAMKAALIKALQESGGDPSAEQFAKVLNGLADELSTAAADSDSKVGKAMKQFAAQATEAAGAADPTTAADNPAFEKSGKSLTAACKAAGVTVNY